MEYQKIINLLEIQQIKQLNDDSRGTRTTLIFKLNLKLQC